MQMMMEIRILSPTRYEKKHEEDGSHDGDVHEEGLHVEALVKLDDLDSLVEDGVHEEVSSGVPVYVGEVDGQTDGTTGESVSGNEGVGYGGLLLGLHGLQINKIVNLISSKMWTKVKVTLL